MALHSQIKMSHISAARAIDRDKDCEMCEDSWCQSLVKDYYHINGYL